MVSSSLQVHPRSQPFACDRKAQLAVRGFCEPLQPANCLQGNRWSLAIVRNIICYIEKIPYCHSSPNPRKRYSSRFVRLKKCLDLKACGHFIPIKS
jgi:hypothetical protein